MQLFYLQVYGFESLSAKIQLFLSHFQFESIIEQNNCICVLIFAKWRFLLKIAALLSSSLLFKQQPPRTKNVPPFMKGRP